MKIYSIQFILLFLLLSFAKSDKPQFIGKWEAFDLKNYHFVINLREKDNRISGDYCAYPKDLSRMDCSTDNSDKCDVFGRRKGDSAYVHFVSCYSGDTGTAVIAISDQGLKWKTLKNPYIDAAATWNGVPDKATLKRIK